MKKIFIILFCLIPFALFGQKTFVNTQVVGTDAVLKRAADTLNPYVPYANRSALTITTDGGIIRFYENGVELRVMAYSPIYETNYYVKTGGDDTKSGLTDEDAWAHHPWMSTWTGSTVLVAGDVVNMKRGDTWTISSPVAPYMTVAQSGSVGKPITTTAYGTGADPIIKIATATDQPVIYADAMSYITFDNLHIQHHGSTYVADEHRNGFEMWNVCHDFIFTNNEISNIPASGIIAYTDCYNITIGNINATTTATTTAYSNHIHDFGYSGIELHGVDPISGESNFNVYYNYIHDATRTVAGQNEYGITFDVDASSTDWPKYATARFNNVQNIDTWQSIGCHGGSYIYFQDNYVNGWGLVGIAAITATAGALTPICDYVYIERNTLEQTIGEWVTGVESAFIKLDGAEGAVTHAYIRDNNIFYTTRPASDAFFGIYIDNVDGVTISGNDIYNGVDAASSYPAIFGYTTDVVNVTIQNNFINQWGIGVGLRGVGVTGAVNIYSNIVINTESNAAFAILASDLSATADVKVYNNTFINNTDYYVYYVFGTAAGSVLDLKNNIIGFTSARNRMYNTFAGSMSGTFTANYNLYWNSSHATPFDTGSSAVDFADFQTAGFEANSPNTDESEDPLFTNGSTIYSLLGDFALGVGSPAINAGVNSGITTDYYGNARVGNYDIGAVEKQ